MLDRKKPYGEVMGDGVGGARWYQDGHYFAPDGTYLFSNPGIPAPHGCAHRTMEQAEAEYQQRQAAQERGESQAPLVVAGQAPPKKNAAVKPPPPLVEPKTPAAPIQAEGLTREQKLAQLNYLQLANLLKAAGGERITGSGAKAKIIAWLLANTSE